MRVNEQTLHGGRVGTGRWVLIGGWVGCWVRRFTTTTTTHHQHFLVKRRASANKPCMAGEHHGPNKCVQHHPPPKFISLLSHTRERRNHGLQRVGMWAGGGGGWNNIYTVLLMISFHAILRWRLLHVFCVPALLLVSTRSKCVQQHYPPTFIYSGMFTVSSSCSFVSAAVIS